MSSLSDSVGVIFTILRCLVVQILTVFPYNITNGTPSYAKLFAQITLPGLRNSFAGSYQVDLILKSKFVVSSPR